MSEVLERKWLVRILLFLLENGPDHKDSISNTLEIRPQTLQNVLEDLHNKGLVTQIFEHHGSHKSTAHKQKLTLEGRKVAEHLQEIDMIINKITNNPTVSNVKLDSILNTMKKENRE